ncbi:MAG: bifunctional hydroxymethylpyrimidine kinase/phosphomethylpyrimidine kinase, partial [Vicinamibacterales bacterium]
MKIVLTIAGSDSCAGAGIQADLKTFSAHGLYAVTTVTAVTAQSPSRITATHIIPTDIITAQIDTMLHDVSIAGIKTGMLAKRENVNIVAAALNNRGLLAVVDPVMQSSSGTTLLEEMAVEDLKNELLP